MKKVLLFIADGSEEAEAVIPADMLRRAGARLTTAGIPGRKCMGAHGITLEADISGSELDTDEKYDMVILPGGMPGMLNLGESETVRKVLETAAGNNSYICAICASPSVLGKYGLLKGRKATCYPGFEENLTGASVSSDRVVRDGNIITSRAPGTAFEFSYELIRVLYGDDTVTRLKNGILG